MHLTLTRTQSKVLRPEFKASSSTKMATAALAHEWLPSTPYATNTNHFMTNVRKFLRRSSYVQFDLTSTLPLLNTRITDTVARDHLVQTSKNIISRDLTP